MKGFVDLPKPTLNCEIAASEQRRNDAESIIEWQITAPDARIEFKILHPSIQD